MGHSTSKILENMLRQDREILPKIGRTRVQTDINRTRQRGHRIIISHLKFTHDLTELHKRAISKIGRYLMPNISKIQ